ncbi:MAG: ATP-binding protein [Gammaproteobacteria bacterium]|nr:ATP-binding protein [Gammaproteobacteria bacterium]
MFKLERIHLLSRPDMLKPLRKFVRELAKKLNCCDESLECLVIAINEACMNVMQHAYNNRQDEEIIIEFWKDNEDLVIKIFDFAEEVEIEKIKSRDLEDIRPGGLGVHFINQSMDCVEYKHISNEKGNVLEMRKNLGESIDCPTNN